MNQRLLKPIHDWLASVFKLLPCDGTFDQVRLLIRLMSSVETYSYDRGP